MKNKYNIKELEEKLEKCINMKLEDINLDDVDEIIKKNNIEQLDRKILND